MDSPSPPQNSKLGLTHQARSFLDVQHMRIIFENRLRQTNNEELRGYVKYLEDLEHNIQLSMNSNLKHEKIAEWLEDQKGVGEGLACQLVGIVGNIERFSNISKLWSYFGMGVVKRCKTCGKRHVPNRAEKVEHYAERLKWAAEKKKDRTKIPTMEELLEKADKAFCKCENPMLKTETQRWHEGELGDYNPTAKTLCFKLSEQFVIHGDKYRELYDRAKLQYQSREGLTKGHIDNMARRKCVKQFLADLWVEWRTVEGLSVSKPYVNDILGHADYEEPSPR